ncbi:MAG: dienelactone hydrolase family protein [Deltaproteobacteria bacterium]|nr:dienelactone hydrolase family protein [bacterium]MCB9476244.1 dienelactone hydrolase family protein [Deltaproteobacteria bacterium]MCB9489891.1 dienelactone hydrolase family protein [Deltaproteobacteria bacterium]
MEQPTSRPPRRLLPVEVKLLAVVVVGAVVTIAILTFEQRALEPIGSGPVVYNDGDLPLEGYLAVGKPKAGPAGAPGVLIVHQWQGLTRYERTRARLLAAEGYVVFAADVYGQGIRPMTEEEAEAESAKYYENTDLLLRRLNAALETLKANPLVDPARIGSVGYCFGGMGALELARSGADLKAVVSVHGTLKTKHPEKAKNIKAELLLLHGTRDPWVPLEEVDGFFEEMRGAPDVKWRFTAYGGAYHAFTSPFVGDNPFYSGAAYHPEADRRSWNEMVRFLDEVL